jgi:hypothetical protein
VNPAQFIQQDSGEFEWYTPLDIIEVVQAVLYPGIDLDPASSTVANAVVKAKKYYTYEDDGLTLPWEGRVWLNPPFSEVARFVDKLLLEYEIGRVTEACVITFASLDTAWARRLAAFPRWYPKGRVNYSPLWEERRTPIQALPGMADQVNTGDRNDRNRPSSPPKGSMVTYIGPNERVAHFAQTFTSRLGGWVDVPWEWHKRRMTSEGLTAAVTGMWGLGR